MFENRKKKKEFVEHVFDNIDYAKKEGRDHCYIYVGVTPKENLSAALNKLHKKGYFWEHAGSDLKIYW